MAGIVARQDLIALVGNAPCSHPSSPLAACKFCVVDALKADPNTVITWLIDVTGGLDVSDEFGADTYYLPRVKERD